MPHTYSFTDYTDYDPSRGGATPEWVLGVDGNKLEVTVTDDCYDAPEVPKTVPEVLAVLEARLAELQEEAKTLTAFLAEARKTTEVVTEESEEEDEDDDE